MSCIEKYSRQTNKTAAYPSLFRVPREWYGQPVEVIIFPLVDANDKLPTQNFIMQNRRAKREKLLDKYLTDLSAFKFNRDEANNYD